MTQTTVTTMIDAPIAKVFPLIADGSKNVNVVPHITKVEYLSEQTTGVGAKFRETRLMNGRESTTELEITEYVENEMVRFIADEGGTIWDSLFTFSEENGQTRMKLVMEARAYKFMAKIFNPLIKGMVKKAIESDMQAVKAYCES
ncbi:MAG: SRPBCC family protein [Gammaproteobacteria bacterium]|nr:SRPBCC family protein [Gammaproteobacteria bacterium]NNC96668.1 SRPBCC family protein [Gammaproteobacteria bacterium]NNM13218.1 SRPBCC family protein [Gammaproteobacteria bacterium]